MTLSGRRRLVGLAVLTACAIFTSAQGRRPENHPPAAQTPSLTPAATAPGPPVEAIRANNIGIALMERGDFEAALGKFQTACIMAPDSDVGCLNMGIAFLRMREYDEARRVLTKSVERDPQNPRAWVNLSLLEQATGNSDAATADLERALALVPGGLDDSSRAKYSLPEEMVAPPGSVPPAIPVHFVDVTALSGLPYSRPARTLPPKPVSAKLADFLGSGVCVFDYDGDGRPDILLLDADGNGNAALYRNTGNGRFADVTKAAKLNLSGGLGCATGDYDNDGHPDLAVSTAGGVRLLHNEGNGTFRDVTEEAGMVPASRDGGLALGLTFFDYDLDGDLDLYATRFTDFPLPHPSQPFQFPEGAPAPGNTLWRSAGSGKFVDWTKEAELTGNASSVGAIEADLQGNGSPDLIVPGWQKLPTVFRRKQDGVFGEASPWNGYTPGPVAGAVALDFDHNGRMGLALTRWAPPGLSLWRNDSGQSFERVRLPELGWMRGWGIAALDYDNDGWVDLVAVGETFAGEGRVVLLRNEGPAGFRDVTHETGLDKIILHNPRSVVAFDAEGDGAMDLLITQNHLPPILLKNIGGNKNNWVELALSGDRDNKMGIGARVEVQFGAQKQAFDISGASGYLSQGPAEVHIGLGAEETLDVLRLRWPSGIAQTELGFAGDQRVSLAEREKEEVPH